MKEQAVGKTLKEICPTCGKRIAPNRQKGSLTSFLFGAFDCSCSREGGVPGQAPFTDTGKDKDENDFCPKCGLMIATNSRDGSLTGFLFQDTRCKCPPDQAFADGMMSDRFRKMKEADSGSIFTSAPTGSAKSSSMSIDLAPGATIGGAYTIIELIGYGGMGEVYLANHKTLGKKCAVKVIPPEQVTEIGWQRFQLEARAVAKLDHVNLVRVTDLGIDNGCLPFYAMDYAEGTNLADLISEHGPLPLSAFLDIFIQVCDGVDCAHRNGILHRDLKPANIMVLPAKTGKSLVKVLDFGLAKLTSRDRSQQSLTAVGEVFGSPLYMSPEQCSGDRVDRRSDVYSLGCTMFECLTGRPPFSDHVPTALMVSHVKVDPPSLESIAGKGKFTASLEVIIAKLLRKNPVERYQTLLELRSDLEKVARGEDVEPFYISRTKQWQAGDGAPQSRTDSTAIPAAVPNRIMPLGGAIVATVALGIVTGMISIAFVQTKRPLVKQHSLASVSLTTNSDLVRQYLKPSFTKAGLASLKDNTPFSKIVEENGKQWRVFEFPVDTTIGFFTTPNLATRPAASTIRSLATDHLVFTPYPCAVKHPEYLKRFRAGDIAEVKISTEGNQSDFVKDFTPGETPEERDYGINDYLKVASAVPGVQKITLVIYRGTSATIDLSLLDKFPSLKELFIQDPKLNENQLSKLSTLKQLETLELVQSDLPLQEMTDAIDITAVLKGLKGSTHMTKLLLLSSKASLDGITDLASLPRLERLTLGSVIPSNPASTIQTLMLLRKALKLQYLLIRELPITPDALTALKFFRELKTLRCNQAKSGISNSVRFQLVRAAARLGLTTTLEFD